MFGIGWIEPWLKRHSIGMSHGPFGDIAVKIEGHSSVGDSFSSTKSNVLEQVKNLSEKVLIIGVRITISSLDLACDPIFSQTTFRLA